MEGESYCTGPITNRLGNSYFLYLAEHTIYNAITIAACISTILVTKIIYTEERVNEYRKVIIVQSIPPSVVFHRTDQPLDHVCTDRRHHTGYIPTL